MFGQEVFCLQKFFRDLWQQKEVFSAGVAEKANKTKFGVPDFIAFNSVTAALWGSASFGLKLVSFSIQLGTACRRNKIEDFPALAAVEFLILVFLHFWRTAFWAAGFVGRRFVSFPV